MKRICKYMPAIENNLLQKDTEAQILKNIFKISERSKLKLLKFLLNFLHQLAS